MQQLFKVFALGAALALLGANAAFSECPRGDLDDRYCDSDGDLIADIPTMFPSKSILTR